MHERKKYRAEDERVMNEWDERRMRVAGEEHIVQRSFPISKNKHVALCFAFPVIFCNLTEMDIENDQIYLDVSFDNVGLEGTEKFILQSSGEILDKDSFIVFNPCALNPRKKWTPLPLNNFWTVNQNSRASLLYLTALMDFFE